eukprot:TRINITY_DN3414_c0_g1_i3.p1 TRINITY_DN3414_c0_g1~~TRINITY_DN3414_c0_g1_i3.p1  ORF type:complete len:512 (-),score=62.63 TRINITY_DN3414_c0_g1_i3:122-1657(-)
MSFSRCTTSVQLPPHTNDDDDELRTPQLGNENTAGASRFVLLLRELQAEHEAELLALRKDVETLRQGSSLSMFNESCKASDIKATNETHFPRRASLVGGVPAKSQACRQGLIFQKSGHTTHSNFFHRIVSNKWFEILCSGIVIMNAIVIAFETQYVDNGVGHQLGYRGHLEQAEEYYPNAALILSILSWIFGSAYVIEFVFRVCASPLRCAMDGWNWFDFVIIVIWFISKFEETFPINSSFLRIARVARLLRLLKLGRSLNGIDSLVIITTAMKGCVSVLLWTFVVLGLVQMLCALLVAQYLHVFYFEEGEQNTDQISVFKYFGTFNRAFFSMWEITLGNWPPACRVLAENVGEAFFTFGMMHKLIIGFAVVAIINGVFTQQTFSVAAMDDVIMVRRKQTAAEYHRRKMNQLWKEADRSGDGEVTLPEWQELLDNPGVKTWLASMELDARDAALVFELLDESNDGTVSFEELVHGVSKLKGAARSIDLHALAREHQKLKDYMCKPSRLELY